MYQILLATPFALDFSFPVSFTSLLSIFSLLGFNVAADSGMTCLWEMDYVDELLVQTLLPLGIAAALFVAYWCHRRYLFLFVFSPELLPDQIDSLESLYIQLFFTMTYLLLTATVNKIFRTFPCHDVDPDDTSSGPDSYMRV